MTNDREAFGDGLIDSKTLSKGEIHVWKIPIHTSSATIAQYRKLLDKKEESRIPFFKFEEAKNSYITSQGALRILLSGYLGISPKLIDLGRRNKGKPYSIDDPDLNFNISNSGNLAVIAFLRSAELGIDIEQIRLLSDLDELIKRNFSAREIKFITANPNEKLQRFFRFWTVKESYLKAIGEGMRLTPDSIEFAFENNHIELLSVKGVFEQEDWKFSEFSPSDSIVGTITYGNTDMSIKIIEYNY